MKKEKILPVKRINLTGQVVNSLKKYIIDENLKPGDKLPSEREFSEIIGVSRNIIREAMSSLESAGIILKLQGKGIFMCSFNEKIFSDQLMFGINSEDTNLQEILKIREVFEKTVLEFLIKKINDTQLELLRKTIDELERKDSDSVKQFVEEDIRFHKLLLSFLGNPLIERIGFVLNEFFSFMIEFDKTLSEEEFNKKKKIFKNDFLTKHRSLIDAISKRDLNKCNEEIYKHLYRPS